MLFRSNVLFLDEPTNDFDVETLSSLEDLLDGFAGTILVVSHDRYFLERVCDVTLGFVGDGILRDLPRGLDQYFELYQQKREAAKVRATSTTNDKKIDSREIKKNIDRLEKAISRRDQALSNLQEDMKGAATDFVRLSEIQREVEKIQSEKEALEREWMDLMEALEDR